MIKLIASDMDGTLLPEGTSNINPELPDVILKLREKGILFVAASGRQFISMQNVFKKIENDIMFIADNGSYVTYQGNVMNYRYFEQNVLEEIIAYVREMKNVFFMVSTPDYAYTDNREETEMIAWIREGYRVQINVVEDVLKIDKKISKVAVFFKDKDAGQMTAEMRPRFKGKANVVASGDHWVDLIEAHTEKGYALEEIQRQMNIRKEETMAFGDNLNDISLLNCAKESYAVAGARKEVKKAAAHVLTDTSADAVMNVLKTLL